MRKIKLSEEAISQIIARLDMEDQCKEAPADARHQVFPYRVDALKVTIEHADAQHVSYQVPTRNISRTGITFLISNLVNSGVRCDLHLITIRNNWQTVRGRILQCRYIPGSACVHEARVEFDHPIDPASFAPMAVRARVLIADDSRMMQRLIEQHLKEMNADVFCVENGIEAIQAAMNQTFDLVLMDIEMPKLNGLDAVRILRGKGYLRCIVAISSVEIARVREESLLAGCDDFISKPLEKNQLIMVVNRTKPEPLVSSLLHQTRMHPLIDEFVSTLPERIQQCEAAFAAQDLEWFAMEVRKLKGEAGSFGFEPITTLATDLDIAMAKEASWTDLRKKLSEMIRMCLAARPATCQADEVFAKEKDGDQSAEDEPATIVQKVPA